jgi:hypothetical protein
MKLLTLPLAVLRAIRSLPLLLGLWLVGRAFGRANARRWKERR